GEVVERRHLVPALEQRVDEHRADEPRPTRDESASRRAHSGPRTSSTIRCGSETPNSRESRCSISARLLPATAAWVVIRPTPSEIGGGGATAGSEAVGCSLAGPGAGSASASATWGSGSAGGGPGFAGGGAGFVPSGAAPAGRRGIAGIGADGSGGAG